MGRSNFLRDERVEGEFEGKGRYKGEYLIEDFGRTALCCA